MLSFFPFFITLSASLLLLTITFLRSDKLNRFSKDIIFGASSFVFLFWIYSGFHFLNLNSATLLQLDPIHFQHISISLVFKIDKISVFFGGLTSFLFIAVSAFSRPYLDRDPSESRFYFLISLLLFSLQMISSAASFDPLVIGWEIAGISSVFLIGFFIKNPDSLTRSLYAFINYKIGDVALLTALGIIHIYGSDKNFLVIASNSQSDFEFWVGLLLILATTAKSAQFPLTAWIKKAVEGPSSSTAIFYGAISIHLGPFLLLRTESWWSVFPSLKGLIAAIGLVTLIMSSAYARTRNDAKTVLIAASQAQVGGIYILIAAGFFDFALLIILGHAGLRTWQILRASSLIHDFQDNLAIYRWITSERPELKNKFLYLSARQGFYIEQTIDWIFQKSVKLLQSIPHSFATQISIAVLTIILSLVFQTSINAYKPFFLAPIIFISIQALATTQFREAFYGALLAMFLHIWVAQLRPDADHSLFLGIVLFETPLLILLVYWCERLLDHFKLNSNLPFFGLGDQQPEAFAIMTIASLLISGAPIGLTFFFEEVIFHNTFSSSISVTLMTIFIVGINTVTLIKSTFRLFGGRQILGVFTHQISFKEKITSAFILSFYLLSMIHPQPILSFLEHLLGLENHH